MPNHRPTSVSQLQGDSLIKVCINTDGKVVSLDKYIAPMFMYHTGHHSAMSSLALTPAPIYHGVLSVKPSIETNMFFQEQIRIRMDVLLSSH